MIWPVLRSFRLKVSPISGLDSSRDHRRFKFPFTTNHYLSSTPTLGFFLRTTVEWNHWSQNRMDRASLQSDSAHSEASGSHIGTRICTADNSLVFVHGLVHSLCLFFATAYSHCTVEFQNGGRLPSASDNEARFILLWDQCVEPIGEEHCSLRQCRELQKSSDSEHLNSHIHVSQELQILVLSVSSQDQDDQVCQIIIIIVSILGDNR